MIRLRMLASLPEAVTHRFRADAVAFLAYANALAEIARTLCLMHRLHLRGLPVVHERKTGPVRRSCAPSGLWPGRSD